ncbi:hypothetical protein [uncultured Lactobacillus sp.]|uniref:hypothetical protein n=1 Tax=uncultured Lactobacillus sp. TaxID=153152 RepID=UPI0026398B80|nr:hypothetical protein [uncultured Lactobacillus sp.]
MNKKILSLLAVGTTLCGVLSAPTSTVFAVHTKSVKVAKKHRHAKIRVAHKKFKVPYKALAGAQPTEVVVTKRIKMFEYNPRLKRILKQDLSSGQVVTATQANNNAWIITHLGYGAVNKGSICVVKGNGWFMTKAERDRRLQNAQRRFNSSIENQVGSQEYNAMRNKLNADRNDIRNWIEQN